MIARRAGTLVSLGMMFGAISGCGTQLDPRLQVNNELREECSRENMSYNDEQIRGILAEIEERRLQGYTPAAAVDAVELKCEEQFDFPQDEYLMCKSCHYECLRQVYRADLLEGL